MALTDRLNISGYVQTPHLSQLRQVADLSGDLGFPAYLVGGFVRDFLLGKLINDFDVVIEGDAVKLGRALVKRFGGRLTIHAPFKTATWFLPNSSNCFIDLISARSETYAHPAALPKVELGTLDDDLGRRDFTINAMAVRLDGEEIGRIIDPLDGRRDLQRGLLRVLHPDSFMDDPTRLLRLIRYAGRYGFKIETGTEALIPSALVYVDKLSPERLRHELDLTLAEEDFLPMLEKMWKYGILMHVNPTLPSDEQTLDRLKRTQSHFSLPLNPVPSKISQTRDRRWIAWLLGLQQKEIRALAKRLHFTADLLKWCLSASTLYESVDSFPGYRPSECVKLLDKLPEESVRVVSSCVPRGDVRSMLQMFLTKWRYVMPHATGEMLMTMGVPFGPRIGEIHWRLRVAWLDGEISSIEEEREFLNRLMQAGRINR